MPLPLGHTWQILLLVKKTTTKKSLRNTRFKELPLCPKYCLLISKIWRGLIFTTKLFVWVIDQVWGQDGWILAKFFFCVFMDRDGVEVHKLAKKERGQYPAILTEQAWSIKDLLYGFRGNFSCGRRRVVPSGQDSSILPARVANHSAGFDSSCPLTELAI